MGRRLARTEGSRPGWQLRGKRGEGELEGRVYRLAPGSRSWIICRFSGTPGKVFAGIQA